MIDSNDILDYDLAPKKKVLVKASVNQRLINYIIDRIIFTVLLMFGTGAFILITGFESWVDDMGAIGEYVFSALIFVTFYFLSELLLDGKTIGKFITKTKVLTETGEKPASDQLLKRSLIRAVPFEAFSFLNGADNGWHDKWSETIVISEKESVY